ncbi:putative uncharacterized protein LINC02906 [Hylobates moloch]|uniref:putative uncharacterized protein LINC02906 n=1 Tax=Hylobates moloch TaxID=81572 RepID=UPI0013F26289|nr:putative uncharacterized protein LINC02906 [Hylobates moloch]
MRTPKRTRAPKRKVSPMRGETLTLQLTNVSLDTRHMVKWCDERHGRPLPHTQESQHGSATSKKAVLETADTAPLERISATRGWSLPMEATMSVFRAHQWQWN